MQPISGLAPGAAQPPAAIAGVNGQPKVQRPEDADQSRPLKPVMDEYVPGEMQEPTGRYWPEKDVDGKLKIYFDDPEQGRGADGAEREADDSGKAEMCTGSTDKVDREIEKLKKKKEELERRIHSETDDAKVKELEKKLAQVEHELRQKDNDTYRRQRAIFS